ncbi:MAG: hypothetical protein M1824_004147 [Vezdaea acicularis]|nr:MAG: hypothetical protein M1824_004147 [Vezdaea acicularis]
MAILEDVRVEIVSTKTGQVYQEYEVPGYDPAHLSGRANNYIEVESGDEFGISITIGRYFPYANATAARATWEIDNGLIGRHDNCVIARQASKPRHLFHFVDHTVRQTSGAWAKWGFSFRDLWADEGLEHASDQFSKKKPDRLGCIRVVIDKGYIQSDAGPVALHDTPSEILVKSSKELIKQRRLDYVGDLFEGEAVDPPIPNMASSFQYEEWIAEFSFQYRSRSALQSLGIIPFLPKTISLREPATTKLTSAEKDKELERLRTTEKQLTLEIERIKMKGGAEYETRTEMKEGLGVKRIRLHLEFDLDEQPSPKKRKLVVDLPGDDERDSS